MAFLLLPNSAHLACGPLESSRLQLWSGKVAEFGCRKGQVNNNHGYRKVTGRSQISDQLQDRWNVESSPRCSEPNYVGKEGIIL